MQSKIPNTVDELLAECRGFMRSRVIQTAASLDLFTRIDESPSTADALAAAAATDRRATARLLDCLAGMGLLRKMEDRYRVTDAGRLLSAHHPETALPMVLHLHRLWENWSHLPEAVVNGENLHRKPVHEEGGEALAAFIGAMHVAGRTLAEQIAGAYDARPFKRLLDVGGGSGTYTIAFLRRHPGSDAVLFDTAAVIPLAERRLASEGLTDRVTLVGGDFYSDDLPGGCDLALLSAIIHQNSRAENVALYRKLGKALLPGGKLLIRDHVMEEDRVRPHLGALFALNMLVCTAGGDTYTLAEIEEQLSEAGFQEVRLLRRGERMDCLVEASRS